MSLFYETLTYLENLIYQPKEMTIKSIKEERQNADYGGGLFKLATKTIRFRVAKKTPTKLGQFVAFWEKDEQNKNQPFSYEAAPDLLVITTAMEENNFGQFVFPKKVLLKNNILKSKTTKGKMATRIYPIWNQPTNKQAIETQKWQLNYFVDLSDPDNLPLERISKLYNQ